MNNNNADYLKIVVVLSIVSAAVLALIFLFSLVSLIPRFKSRHLSSALGVFTMLNGNFDI